MSARVLLHIGINETGAPDLQRWLSTNQEALRKRGILYPAVGRRNDGHDPLAELAQPHVADEITGRTEIDVSRMLSIRDDLRNEIADSGASDVIISSERFGELADLAPVQDLLRNLRVQIVISLRRHDFWWEAVYRDAIARQCRQADIDPALLPEPGFPAFYRACTENSAEFGDYQRLIDRWAVAFGKENILINAGEEPMTMASVVSSFLLSTGLEETAGGLPLPATTAKPPLSRRQLQLLELFLRIPTTPDVRQQLVRYALAQESNSPPTPVLAPRRCEKLVKQHLPAYQQIAATFLTRKKLFKAVPTPAKTDTWEAPGEISITECASEVIKALVVPKQEPSGRHGFLARLLAPD